MVECIEISLKSFESKLVQNAVSQIIKIYNEIEVQNYLAEGPSIFRFAEGRKTESFNWKLTQFAFPMTQKKFTVLRSPHIDKKSREQFQIQYFKNRILLKASPSSVFRPSVFRSAEGRKTEGRKPIRSVEEYREGKTQENRFSGQLNFCQLFIENMKRTKFLGVQIKIRIVYRTWVS
jgi:ribosomal protein S10